MAKLHGWYSQKMRESIAKSMEAMDKEERDKWSPASIYLTPEGDEVIVTMVDRSEDSHGTGWDDVVYVGVVTRHIKSLS
jgi:hypothetical protein